MVAKPTGTLPQWALTGTRTEPAGSKINSGWTFEEAPPYDYFNWHQGVVGDWIAWLDDRIESTASSVSIWSDGNSTGTELVVSSGGAGSTIDRGSGPQTRIDSKMHLSITSVLNSSTSLTEDYLYTLPGDSLALDKILRVRAGVRTTNESSASDLALTIVINQSGAFEPADLANVVIPGALNSDTAIIETDLVIDSLTSANANRISWTYRSNGGVVSAGLSRTLIGMDADTDIDIGLSHALDAGTCDLEVLFFSVEVV